MTIAPTRLKGPRPNRLASNRLTINGNPRWVLRRESSKSPMVGFHSNSFTSCDPSWELGIDGAVNSKGETRTMHRRTVTPERAYAVLYYGKRKLVLDLYRAKLSDS